MDLVSRYEQSLVNFNHIKALIKMIIN